MSEERKVIELPGAAPAPQQPEIAGQLVLTLYATGDYNVQGPLEDRIMYNALCGLAVEAGIRHSLEREARLKQEAIARQAAQPRKSPGLVKRFMDAASGKTRREAEAAAKAESERLETARKAREEAAALKAKREAEARSASGTGAPEETTNKSA